MRRSRRSIAARSLFRAAVLLALETAFLDFATGFFLAVAETFLVVTEDFFDRTAVLLGTVCCCAKTAGVRRDKTTEMKNRLRILTLILV
jgi:hypothetical protein